MADEQPSVEITPTVIISNSEEGGENVEQQNNGGQADNSLGAQSEQSQSDAVVIAAIEAERDVSLAEIHGDIERERIAVEETRVEAITERNEELEKCRKEIAELRARVEEMALLIPPPQLVVETEMETLPIVQESDLIQPDTVAPTVETLMEPSEEKEEEKQVAEETKIVRKFIAI